jgi:hypothetical protein
MKNSGNFIKAWLSLAIIVPLLVLWSGTALAYDMGYYEINRLNPVLYFDFEAQYSTDGIAPRKTYDISGNYLNGIENTKDSVIFSRDANKNATADFSGVGNYLSVPYNSSLDFDISDSFTISMRVNAPDSGAHAELIHAPVNGKYAYRAYLLSDKNLNFCIYDGTNSFCKTSNFTNYYDKWSSITMAKNGTQLCIALDGADYDCSSFSGLGSTKAGSGELRIGLHPSGANDYNGKMDELIIFRGFVSHENVVRLYDKDVNYCGNGVCNANENAKSCSQDCATSTWETGFLDTYYGRYINVLGTNHDFDAYTYNGNNYIRSFLDMYESTGKKWYLEQAIKISEKFITWQVTNPDATYPILDSVNPLLINRDGDVNGRLELPADRYPEIHPDYAARLEVSRLYRELTSLAKVIKNNIDLKNQYNAVADRIIYSATHDVLDNPLYSDIKKTSGFSGELSYPLHHLIAHHAIILKNMYELTGNQAYGDIASDLINQMVATTYFGGQDGNDPLGVAWGGIQCTKLNYSDSNCYYENETYDSTYCKDSDSAGHTYCFPMDTAHSRDTVDTFLQFYEDGYMSGMSNGGSDFIDRLVYTINNTMIKDKAGYSIVEDFINGVDAPVADLASPDYWRRASSADSNWIGISPGWTGLGKYDNNLNQLFIKMKDNALNTSEIGVPAFWPNYYAEMLKNSASLNPPINGTCGAAQGTYLATDTYWRDPVCANGLPSPLLPWPFLAPGTTMNWQCIGQNGGTTADCSATRASNVIIPSAPSSLSVL